MLGGGRLIGIRRILIVSQNLGIGSASGQYLFITSYCFLKWSGQFQLQHQLTASTDSFLTSFRPLIEKLFEELSFHTISSWSTRQQLILQQRPQFQLADPCLSFSFWFSFRLIFQYKLTLLWLRKIHPQGFGKSFIDCLHSTEYVVSVPAQIIN